MASRSTYDIGVGGDRIPVEANRPSTTYFLPILYRAMDEIRQV